MSFIPTFGMIPVVATSYQFWYEYHTSVFAVYLYMSTGKHSVYSGVNEAYLCVHVHCVCVGLYVCMCPDDLCFIQYNHCRL